MKKILLLAILATVLAVSAHAQITSCGTVITQSGNYTVDGNLTAQPNSICIDIQADNVEILCNQKHMFGSGSGTAIRSDAGNYDVTVRHCNIVGFENGIYFDSTVGSGTSGIFENLIRNSKKGIILLGASSTIVEDNRLVDNQVGLRIEQSFKNTITNNLFEGQAQQFGVFMYFSGSNEFDQNAVFVTPGSRSPVTAVGVYASNYNVFSDSIISGAQTGFDVSKKSIRNSFLNTNFANVVNDYTFRPRMLRTQNRVV